MKARLIFLSIVVLAGVTGGFTYCSKAATVGGTPVDSTLKGLAEAYPHDAGIEKDASVLYVEKFDDGLDKIAARYDDVRNKDGMSTEADVPDGSVSHSIKMTNTGGQNDGGHLYKLFPGGFDSTIYLRYYVKYPSVSKGYIHHESVWFGGYNPGTTYTNPRAGSCGLGDARISIAYEPVVVPGMDTYLYWGGMRSWNGGGSCYGNDMVNGSPTARNIAWDQWMCIEVMVKLNNPVTAYNGELRVWQDGKEVGYWGPGFPQGYWDADSWYNNTVSPGFEGFRWRTDAHLNINYIWIEFYDDKSPAGENHYIKYSNLVMARKYIGPMKK
ncbi:MAG: hypothetical protein J0H74_34055 [Chitinophagaceae bacterium]|nr:hypothetical protein [Chitinophagaceae bacterium]